MTTITFYKGLQLEFYKDGDRCEVIGNHIIRDKYKIDYKSIKTGKKYATVRNNLIELHKNGELEIFHPIK